MVSLSTPEKRRIEIGFEKRQATQAVELITKQLFSVATLTPSTEVRILVPQPYFQNTILAMVF